MAFNLKQKRLVEWSIKTIINTLWWRSTIYWKATSRLKLIHWDIMELTTLALTHTIYMMSSTTITRIFCLIYSDVWTLLRKLFNIQSCAGPQTFWVSLKRILLTKALTQVTTAHQYIPWKIVKIWKVLKALYFTKLNQYKMSYLLTNRLLRFGERKFMLINCWYQRFSEF